MLAQKPFALSYQEAKATVDACERAGLKLAVNQNMRYDQSIRALKTLLDRGYLGEPVLATIEMRAIPHWMPWAREYDRLTLPIMSIHHLDIFRYLFGDPGPRLRQRPHRPAHEVPASRRHRALHPGIRRAACAPPPGTTSGPARRARAPRPTSTSMAGRGHRRPGAGHDRLARISERGPQYHRVRHRRSSPAAGSRRKWTEAWFPDAFEGTMGELLAAIARTGRPPSAGATTCTRWRWWRPCYRSLDEHRPVSPTEIIEEEQA